ncbi:NifU family protein [Streptomyces oceani]|uniref:Nitrogen fixation protein NifU n=1 Tax=Streptomyces oceani TaxID=1075402 RepID=A0A1E7KH66_9ACTN|nr:NifU family protein [Streptomyces oceani]OEV03216.1 nitrogen fixation protein NifU [Streptomyces oceani]
MAERSTAGHSTAAHERLDDPAVGQRLARIDELLERVEEVAGPTAEAALDAVRALTEVYGEALARVLDFAPDGLTAKLTGDKLLNHLLVLHDLHPDPTERRVSRAVEDLRPAVQERGGDVELAGVDEGVAHIRLTSQGCGGSSGAVGETVREAVLAVAPELTEVRQAPASDGAGSKPAFVPLNALLRPSASGTEPT